MSTSDTTPSTTPVTALADRIMSSIFAIFINGDLNGVTYYTTANQQQVFFLQAPPLCPASSLQIWERDRMRRAMVEWNTLAPSAKKDYATCVRILSLPCSATSLWFSLATQQTPDEWKTLCRQSRLALAQPTYQPLT